MVKRLFIILSIITIIVIPTSILKISNDNYPQFVWIKNNNDSIGKLIINKISLKEELYPINNSKNNIEEHVTIIEEIDNTLVLAAHSGIGNIAYFERLDELNINDEIILYYKNKKYKYVVKEIWEEKKNGYIHINKENKRQLVLTTCSPKKEKYQLIVNCIEKEST